MFAGEAQENVRFHPSAKAPDFPAPESYYPLYCNEQELDFYQTDYPIMIDLF
jgi:hypothetical protein